MDAQNATEAASTKPSASSASSASSRLPDSDRPKPNSSTGVLTKSPVLSRAVPSSSKDAKPTSSKSPPVPASTQAAAKAPSEGQGAKTVSPPGPRERRAPATSTSRDKQDDDSGGTDGNSEAETIVLSKDGSPAKPRSRKMIKHEDKPNGASASSAAGDVAPSGRRHTHISDRKESHTEKGTKTSTDSHHNSAPTSSAGPSQMKKKRLHEKLLPNSQTHARVKGASSSLSSVPASPPRSRKAPSRPQSGSDTDRGHRSKSPKRSLSTTSKDRLRPPEKLVSYKRKAPKAESDDDTEGRKARRLRLANAGAGAEGALYSTTRAGKDSSRTGHGNASNGNGNMPTTKSTIRASRDSSPSRSLSPQPRSHRRSLSTHLPSQSSGLSLKKKRVPPPLQSTDYNSDESSASGSPHIRSAKLRRLTTPATAESAISPAKIGPHKKHLDAHGQTFLARACARGEYDLAKQRLQERPEDLNVADFAGNTPLQIAALNGYGEIVKFLIDAGCNLDCVNYDKDTPLLDAVDNGHLEVVRLLLDAGVNPRKANVNGEEPLDRVDEDVDNATEIRAALLEARKKGGERRLTSEEHRHENDDLRFLQNPDSPRRSPAPGGANSRRAGTVRATKTSNHLLYMPMDDKTLRLAAGRGDEQNVIRILQVRDAFDDPESMVAASRGGHDVVLQLLLALGKANPDPLPITTVPAEHATPMLAAIGQENLKVISLLLEQSSFDPTKRFNGETYYEIARQRAGPNWKEEEDILKKAYDAYKKTHGNKTKSPPRKSTEARRSALTTEGPEEGLASTRGHKRKLSSPSQERPKKTALGSKAPATATSPREEKGSQKRSDHNTPSLADGKASPKRASSHSVPVTKPSKQRDDRSSVASNLDHDTPPPPKQLSKSRKVDSDSVAVLSEGETTKPRRKKLVSGRELKDGKVREKEREREREKLRRASMASTNTTTPSKESTSPREPRNDDVPSEKEKIRVEKHRERDRDRARQLKKEDSKESSSGASGEGAGKRHRLSETPPNAGPSDKDAGTAPIKRRRLEVDGGGREKKSSKGSAPPDDAPSKASASSSRESQGPASSKAMQKRREEASDDRKASSSLKTKKREVSSDRGRKDSLKPSVAPLEKSIHVKSEDVDVEMADAGADVRSSNGVTAAAEARAQREKDDEKKKKAEKAEAEALLQTADAKKKEEELQRRRQEEEEEKQRKEEKRKKEEEKRKREEEEAAAKLKEEEEKKKELEEKKKKEEEEKLRQRKKLEEEERKRKEEEKKRREEEEETRRREEEERKRKLEEEERKRRHEEERLRREKLEREAAEEARLKLEEEERLQRERQEQERIRAEKEAEEVRRRQFEEAERIRIAKLPPLLRWLSICPNSKLRSLADLFKVMQGVRYDCISPDATGTLEGREQWLVNTQVALLFGEKDLQLSQYPTWRRLRLSKIAKQIIWNLESDRYSLTDPSLFDIGKQLPGFYGVENPRALGTMGFQRLRCEAWDKFSSTDMFFVKVSDVMAVIPSMPHLRDIRLAMEYRELPEHESQLTTVVRTQKWKNDPDADKNLGFAPGTKYFVNGVQVGEHRPGLATLRKTPPPVVRVPRRGFVSVAVEDPDFERICKEQHIDPLSFPAFTTYKSKHQIGVPQPPQSTAGKLNGRSHHAHSPISNGGISPGSSRLMSLPGGQISLPIINGISGTKNS